MAEPAIELLVADDDAGFRSMVAALASARVDPLVVHEAADGAEAVEIGRARRPQVAFLDVAMPRLDGIEAALVLRELRPRMAVALHTSAPLAHRDRAQGHGLLLFDKLDLDAAVGWVALQAQRWEAGRSRRPARPRRLILECAACGYGIARAAPPKRCPMCQSEVSWIDSSRRRRARAQLTH
jgi:CheY-like chemotaxis protein